MGYALPASASASVPVVLTREVLIPEVVPSPIMPWKCIDCGHKWMDRADCKGVQAHGCHACGSKNIFDCNVTFIGFIVTKGPAA